MRTERRTNICRADAENTAGRFEACLDFPLLVLLSHTFRSIRRAKMSLTVATDHVGLLFAIAIVRTIFFRQMFLLIY